MFPNYKLFRCVRPLRSDSKFKCNFHWKLKRCRLSVNINALNPHPNRTAKFKPRPGAVDIKDRGVARGVGAEWDREVLLTCRHLTFHFPAPGDRRSPGPRFVMFKLCNNRCLPAASAATAKFVLVRLIAKVLLRTI